MIVVITVALMLSSIPFLFLNAWALTSLWAWFIVPFGLPPIGMAWAMGLSTLASLLRGIRQEPKTEGAEALKRLGMAYLNAALLPLICLLVGWIAHSFMVAA